MSEFLFFLKLFCKLIKQLLSMIVFFLFQEKYYGQKFFISVTLTLKSCVFPSKWFPSVPKFVKTKITKDKNQWSRNEVYYLKIAWDRLEVVKMWLMPVIATGSTYALTTILFTKYPQLVPSFISSKKDWKKNPFPKCVHISHRGGACEAYENTLKAFKLSRNTG